MKSLIIAFAMYSKIPMPRVDWEKKALSWALCWFPLVGAVIGAVLYGWMALARYLGFGPLFFAAFALLIPIALSGGIHLDGFCDTCDALRRAFPQLQVKLEREVAVITTQETPATCTEPGSTTYVATVVFQEEP